MALFAQTFAMEGKFYWMTSPPLGFDPGVIAELIEDETVPIFGPFETEAEADEHQRRVLVN